MSSFAENRSVQPERRRLRLGRRAFVALLVAVPFVLAAMLLLVAAFVAVGLLSLLALAAAGIVLIAFRRRRA